MAAGSEPLDASNIGLRLWVGGRPPFDRDLPEFDVLALCAKELQPDRLAFHGAVIRCPIMDTTITTGEVRYAVSAAHRVATALAAGQRVLVTCAAGQNRSALVASLALARITRMNAAELIQLMRTKRHPMALHNPYFTLLIHRLVGPGRANML